jgi:MFS family permease
MERYDERRNDDFQIRSLIPSVYLPTLLFSIGQGAILPVIPLYALSLGASVAGASFVVSMRGIGTMLLDVPGGILESRLGDKAVMMLGTALVALVAVGASFATSPLVLAFLILLMGGGWSFWLLARLAYVSEIVPLAQRGRALSVVGGTNRIGTFIGPILGGFMGREFGLESVFYLQAVLGLCAAIVMAFSVRKSVRLEDRDELGVYQRFANTVTGHYKVFLTAGLAVVALQLLRQARQVFIPLWGDSIGLDVAQIGLIFGLSSAIDMTLFYPVGAAMDRWGRKWVAIPSLIVLSLSLALIPVSDSFLTLAFVGLLAGLGNGLGAGVGMTLGADFAPEEARGEFLGVWRLVGDIGTAGGPLIIGLLAAVATLGAASAAVAGIGMAGAALLAVFVPEPLRRHALTLRRSS